MTQKRSIGDRKFEGVFGEFAPPMQVAESEEDDEEDVEIQEVEPPTISMQAALSYLDDLYKFSIKQSDNDYARKVCHVKILPHE